MDRVRSNIIVFDGYCNFCSGAVRFIYRRDKKKRFYFTAAQTDQGELFLSELGIKELARNSLVLVKSGKILQKSTAALNIAINLRGLWPVFFVFIIVPPFIRDPVYDLIARNRYRIAGMRDNCFLPDEDMKSRFI